jgi:hypothetical protein
VRGDWTGFVAIGTASGTLEAGTFLVEVALKDAEPPVPAVALQLKAPWSTTAGGGRRRIRTELRAMVEVCSPASLGASPAQMTLFYLNGKGVYLLVNDEGDGCRASIMEILDVDGSAQYRFSPRLEFPIGVWHDVAVELPETDGGAETVRVTVDTEELTYPLSPTAPKLEYEQLLGATQGTFVGTQVRIRYDRFRVVYLR